jgi:Zn-dependent peptidase ImmA (M78 family)
LATKITLKHGFKASAERLAKEYREKLKIHPCAALCAFKLAEYLGIEVFKATDFVNADEHINLLSGANGEKCEWSALTMFASSGKRIIIHNHFHSDARQQSDMMHELAHIICDHKHEEKKHDFELPVGLRSYNSEQEEEAKCLGSTLQLATPCLLWANNRNMPYEEIATHFNSSIDMVKYRMNLTGIAKRNFFKKQSN